MAKPEKPQQDALECLRLEADCKQLAGAVRRTDLQSHFARIAQAWNERARARLEESGDKPPSMFVSHGE